MNFIRMFRKYSGPFYFASVLLISARTATQRSFTSASGFNLNHYGRYIKPAISLRPSRLYMSSMGGGIENPMSPNLYTEKAWDSIAKLPQYAKKYSTQSVEASHLVRALFDEGPAGLTQRILSKAGVEINAFDRRLEEYLNKQPRVSDSSNVIMAQSLMDCLVNSNRYKKDFGDQFISVEHLLLSAANLDGFTKKLMSESGCGTEKLKDTIKSIRGSNRVTSRNPEASYEALSKYSRDLTAAAAEGKLDPVIGRDEEIRRTIQILSRRSKNNPILLGEPGVGKTAIVEGLAQRIVSGDVPVTPDHSLIFEYTSISTRYLLGNIEEPQSNVIRYGSISRWSKVSW